MNSKIRTESPQKIAEWLQWLVKCAYNNKISWHDTYNIVFSDDVSKVIFERFDDFDYYDPDADYSDDVCAFVNSFVEYANDMNDKQGFTFDEYLTNNKL